MFQRVRISRCLYEDVDFKEAEHLDLHDPLPGISDPVSAYAGGQNSRVLCHTGSAFGINYSALWFSVPEGVLTGGQQYVYASCGRIYHADKAFI